ncbi:MAG: Npt1/Npt2 family nucleotide transporter [Bacteroidota bacterium]
MLYKRKKRGGFSNSLFKKGDDPKHFYVLCIIKFFISLVFTIFKIQKTSNVVLKKGAESIPSIKLIVLFVAILAAYLYTSLSNKLSQQQLSYALLFFFSGLFALYAFVIYPNLDRIKPDIKKMDPGYQDYMLVRLYSDWPIVFFYVVAELFGQFCIVVFFWGVANDLYNKQQAKRFYQWFIAAGCFGGITGAFLSKRIVRYCGEMFANIRSDNDKYNRLLLEKASQITSIIALLTLIVIGLFYKYIRESISATQPKIKLKKEKNPSFMESLRIIYSNNYLIALSILIISCGVSMNIVQVTYKSYVKKHAANDVIRYVDYEANPTVVLNLLCILGTFFLTSVLLKRLSWKQFAGIAPCVIFVLGFSFFTGSTFRHWGWLSFLGSPENQITFVTWIAFADGTFGVLTKYIIFDNAKERAWLGVNKVTKRKSKGAVDVVSSRSGKGISSIIHIVFMRLFMQGEDVTIISPYLLVAFTCFIILWFYSVNYIGNELEQQQQQKKVKIKVVKKS